MEHSERRAWLFPRPTGPGPDPDPDLDVRYLDPADEDERRSLIEGDHPELADALADDLGPDEVEIDGQRLNPRLHIAVHEVAANQLWNDDPPEAWATVERLIADGYERHEILHMLASVVSQEIWHVQRDQAPFDRERYVAALAALPDSWEAEREAESVEGVPDDPLAVVLADGRMAYVPDLLKGTTFTHRLSEEETAGEVVALDADLAVVAVLVDAFEHVHLVDGSLVEVDASDVEDEPDVLTGPDGWLGGAAAGELVGFRFVGTDIEVVPSPAAAEVPDMLAARIRAAFDRRNQADGMPIAIEDLICEVAADAPALVQGLTLPPLTELLAACDFEAHVGFTAPAATDWDVFDRVRQIATVGVRHGLDAEHGDAFMLACQLFQFFVLGETGIDDRDTARNVGNLLGDPHVAEAFVDYALSVAADRLGPFAGALRTVSGRQQAGPAWIESVAAGRLGEVERAESCLREALAADGHFEPAVEDAAWYASDRGDARRAVQLLGRLERLEEDGDDDRITALSRYIASPTERIGRNDPCPCGSGRKYKQCHLGVEIRRPLPDRVRWIWEKLAWFLMRGGFLGDTATIALELAGGDPDRVSPFEHELAMSLVLFQDRTVEEFLARRGVQLPDDERDLVTDWAGVERSLHEIAGVDPGSGMTLRDVRTDEVADVRERLGSRQAEVGDLIFAHVVPDGVGHQIVGGMTRVSAEQRDPLVDLLDRHASGSEIAALVAGPA